MKLHKLSLKHLLTASLTGLVMSGLLGLISSIAGVALLGVSGWFISAAGLAGGLLFFNYFTPGAIIRLMAILRTAGKYGEQVFAHSHLLDLLRLLRLWVWDQRADRDPALVSKESKGDLLQRIVADVDQIIRWPLMVFFPWLYALGAYCLVICLAFYINASLGWPLLVGAILHLCVIPYLLMRWGLKRVYSSQVLGIHRRSRFISVFSSLITLTIRGNWSSYSSRLHQLDNRQRKNDKQIQMLLSVAKFLINLVTIALLTLLVTLAVQYESSNKHFTLIDGIDAAWFVGLLLSLLALNELMTPLAQLFLAHAQAKVGLKRLKQIEVQVKPKSNLAISHIDTLSFKNWKGVHLPSLLGSPIVSMSLKVGDTLAIIGKSGCGKSTLLSSMAGECYSQGLSLINDQVIDLYGEPAYQAYVSYLPQSPYIFQQSVAANIRLGKPEASDEEVLKALAAVKLDDWARGLPQGMYTFLSAQGKDLSGGQIKRLALARLLIRKAPILLLDEPFDGLDQDTIEHLITSLEGEYKPNILVFISHIDTRLNERAKSLHL